MWLKNFERVQEIQQQIQWQPVTELEPRAFIPEVRVSYIMNCTLSLKTKDFIFYHNLIKRPIVDRFSNVFTTVFPTKFLYASIAKIFTSYK